MNTARGAGGMFYVGAPQTGCLFLLFYRNGGLIQNTHDRLRGAVQKTPLTLYFFSVNDKISI